MILAFIQVMENPEERELAKRIFKEQFSRMQALAFSILNNKQDAEDAAMDAMRYICDNISKFADYDSPETIHLISLNTKHSAIDIYRKNKKDSENLSSIDAYGNDSTGYKNLLEDFAVSDENAKALLQALDMIGDMYRTPILLKYTYNMRVQDIAAYMNVDAGTVSGRLFRAKKMIVQALHEMGYER